MMRITQLILFFLLLVFESTAQSWSAPISGKVISIGEEPMVNIKVFLLENKLEIDSVYTDSLGEFSFVQEIKINHEYALKICCHKNRKPITVFRGISDTSTMVSYFIEESCYTPRNEKFDNSAYFAYNSIDSIANFDAKWFRSLLVEYPNMCLEFKQIINPAETSQTAKERMIYFKSLLVAADCDMNRLKFSSEILKLDKKQMSLDKRSRIQGVVTSMDGGCK